MEVSMPFGRWFCAVTLTSCLLSLPAYAQTAKASLKMPKARTSVRSS